MYEFYDRGGVEYVRISVGIDVVERVATEADHEVADATNAGEKAAAEALEAATKERIERENANERRARGLEPDAPAYVAPQPSQQQLEKEFDAGLQAELDEGHNGKHKRGRKGAE
jgi:hypothetical protein